MKNKSITQGIISFLGNSLEFYEFTVYGVFATIFAKHFFPSDNEFLSLMYSWATFSVGFIMRPLGALLFGYLGDTKGRRVALTFSVLLMALSTLSIGLLPTFSSIGLAAPILLISLRMLQGLSTGGEYNGAAIFLIERLGEKRSGFIGGIITSSCVVGAITGTIFGKYLIGLGEDSWRLAFLVGGAAGLLIFMSRFLLQETPAFLKDSKDRVSLSKILLRFKSKFILNMFIGGLNGAFSYVLFGFSLIYLSKYAGFSSADALSINLVGLTAFFLGSMIFGHVYDVLGHRNYLSSLLAVLFMLAPLSVYFFSSGDYLMAMTGIIVWGALTGAVAGPMHAILQKNVPVNIRYRLVAVSFSLGMGIAGGTTPAVMTFLIEKYGMLYAPAIWVCLIGVLLASSIMVERKRSEIPDGAVIA